MKKLLPLIIASLLLTACATSKPLTNTDLDEFGVKPGMRYAEAVRILALRGYQCDAVGTRRENPGCSKQKGFFPTCVLRVNFTVNDANAVEHIQVPQAACMGTP